MHSATWDSSYDLSGKKVAVIEGGSSAVQIIPNIQPSKSSHVNKKTIERAIAKNYTHSCWQVNTVLEIVRLDNDRICGKVRRSWRHKF
jgi:cation diffusion facilitator CzcD-associated flavoprotein CzcO